MKFNKYIFNIRNWVKKNNIPIKTYLLYFIVFLALIVGMTYSRYVTAGNSGSESANVAKPIICLSGDGKSSFPLVLDDIYPGVTNYSPNFIVTNDNGTYVSETSMQYTISVQVATPDGANLPVTYSLQQYDGANWNDVSSSTIHYSEAAVSTTDTYRIKATWDNTNQSNNSFTYMTKPDWLTVEVNWQQLGPSS